jgi:hypothetical protein
MEQLDSMLKIIRSNEVGEMRLPTESVPPRPATEYFRQSCHIGVSQPRPDDLRIAVSDVGLDRLMWGSDYPHEEGTHPYTTEHLRQVTQGMTPEQIQDFLGGNAAQLYGFDLEALRPAAEKFGPTVAEVAEPLTELPADANQALKRAAEQLAARV